MTQNPSYANGDKAINETMYPGNNMYEEVTAKIWTTAYTGNIKKGDR